MVTALYRRYRPESFADVIGQDHVTAPLRQALRADRTHHAYLFSGPRGCGKTTSARILARCLNCVQGPTDTPCGQCDSCRDLARGGAGSLDVVEIDAASHGGVDDARDLRERAVIAPVRDRYKVFVIDEAHMVTSQGFNALLKLVEEPPEHVKFVFATTEPDKVLATIRSRTHHYPFHLVPADILAEHLTAMCANEGVPVDPGVIPLVVRAGGGSVRDSLSVLDQLISGSGPEGVDHDRAAALLGFTSGPLLDDIVAALSAADGATLFSLVDRILAGGQDPRRFIEDLLARLRDLILVQALSDDARSVLRAVPDDQLGRMRQQAALLHPGELSRAADLTSTALNEMVGASTPRVQVELLAARLLLPDADHSQRGAGARLDRIERWLASPPGGAPESGQRPVASPTPAQQHRGDEETQGGEQTPDGDQTQGGEHEGTEIHQWAETRQSAEAPAATGAQHGQEAAEPPDAGESTERLRRLWPEVLGELRTRSRATWSAVSEYAQVVSCEDGELVLGFSNAGALGMFARGAAAEQVAQAVQHQTNLRVHVRATPFERRPHIRQTAAASASDAVSPAGDAVSRGGDVHAAANMSLSSATPRVSRPSERMANSADLVSAYPSPQRRAAPRSDAAAGQTRQPAQGQDEDLLPTRDDPDAPEANVVGLAVLADVLGGEVLDESDPP